MRCQNNVHNWTRKWKLWDTGHVPSPRREIRGDEYFPTALVGERWRVSVLDAPPALRGSENYRVPRIYYTKANLIEECPSLKDKTYSLAGTQACRDMGLRKLPAAGWGPDRA